MVQVQPTEVGAVILKVHLICSLWLRVGGSVACMCVAVVARVCHSQPKGSRFDPQCPQSNL